MNKSLLRASAALQALALLSAGATAFVAAAPAFAQDYTSGVLTGTVLSQSGAPVAGARVSTRSLQQGTVVSSTTGANGGFTFSSLPAGDYDVSVQAAGSQPYKATAVQIVSGRTTNVPVQLASATAQKDEIVVVGRRVQAFTGTTTGLNVDVEQLQKTVPVGRSLNALILLAPTTSQGDSAFGNLSSVGGSSVAENAYYINGLNITNFDNYLGSATVPFDFYKTVEVKAGGYPAEYGRATGGIINAVTKSGTNDWTGAVHVTWSPEALRSDGRDLLNCSGDPGAVTCVKDTSRHYDYDKNLETSFELGGPVIRDRLFVYGLLQLNDHRSLVNSVSGGAATRFRNNDPFWGIKVDAIPISGQHLELTVFDTRNTEFREQIDTTYDAKNVPTYGGISALTAYKGGGLDYVGKYTGRFTDFFTISGAYGKYRDRFDFQGLLDTAGQPYVQNVSGDVYAGVGNNGFYTSQQIASQQNPYNLERRFLRGDADLLVTLFGRHHFRAGLDKENDRLTKALVNSGGSFLCAGGYLTPAACNAGQGGAGAIYLIQPGGQVQVSYFNTGGTFTQKNDAIYLQDEWRPTDRLTINAGIRRDNFKVTDAAGQKFAVLKNNWAPRIGLSYNLWADKSGTVKGFFGQYYLPFASNTAFRNVGGEYFFSERYNISGFDSNGVPILGSQVTDRGDYQSPCPLQLTPSSSGQFCQVTGTGKVPDSTAVIDRNLKATKESEFILGYEQRWNGWKFGIAGTYRKLLRESEDSAIDAAVLKYCAANGIPNCSSYYTGFAQYVINNPGSPITVNLPGVPGNPLVTLTPDQLGYPKAKRTYKALEFTFDHPYNGVWSLGGSYVLSYSKGNSEGFVQSDFGQTDAGITQDFDQPGFIPGSSGFLPNDRRHKFKLFGAYTFWDRLTVGANAFLLSPRPLSCFGFNPTDLFANGYGAASHYCNGVLSPRGTASKTAWVKQLDMKFALNVPVSFYGSSLTLRADIFNVFNSRAVEKRNEFGDLDITTGADGLPNSYIPNPNYNVPTRYQAPRLVRIGLDVTFGGRRPAPPPPPLELAPPPPPPEAPAAQTCADGSVILATAVCPVPPPPPPPPPPVPAPTGERGQ